MQAPRTIESAPPAVTAPKGLRLVEKTVEVLNLLADHGEMSIAGLAQHTGEPRSSLYRLLDRLEAFELVEPASSRGLFRLGTHLLRWGDAAQSGLDVRQRALPIMERMRDETGLTVYLLIRRGEHAVCIERLEGLRVALLTLRVGGALPLHVGAAPRALLVFDTEQAWHEYVDGREFEQLQPTTPTDTEGVLESFRRDRELGVTISDGDVNIGIASMGAPIYDHRNAIHAAVSLSGLRDAVLGEDAARITDVLKRGAADISRALGADIDSIRR